MKTEKKQWIKLKTSEITELAYKASQKEKEDGLRVISARDLSFAMLIERALKEKNYD
jgi:hypothetical protein